MKNAKDGGKWGAKAGAKSEKGAKVGCSLCPFHPLLPISPFCPFHSLCPFHPSPNKPSGETFTT